MLINKIFHLHQPLAEASRRLREPETWEELDAQMRITMREGTRHFEFIPRNGEPIAADIRELPGDEPGRIIFRSVAGDVELAGMIELFEIRENLTEAVLTVDYKPVSQLQKACVAVDRFLNHMLGRLEQRLAERAACAAGYSRFA